MKKELLDLVHQYWLMYPACSYVEINYKIHSLVSNGCFCDKDCLDDDKVIDALKTALKINTNNYPLVD